MGKPENTVESYLIKRCEENGCLCYKFTSPSLRGVPDRIVVGYGQTIFVELKSDDGYLSEIQKLRIKELIKHGATVAFVASATDVDILMRQIKNHNTKHEVFLTVDSPLLILTRV